MISGSISDTVQKKINMDFQGTITFTFTLGQVENSVNMEKIGDVELEGISPAQLDVLSTKMVDNGLVVERRILPGVADAEVLVVKGFAASQRQLGHDAYQRMEMGQEETYGKGYCEEGCQQPSSLQSHVR